MMIQLFTTVCTAYSLGSVNNRDELNKDKRVFLYCKT